MNHVKNLINRIPAPYRAFVCAVAIVAALYCVMSVGRSFYRAIDEKAYQRGVSKQRQVADEAHTRSAAHEQTADEAHTQFDNLEKQNTELEPRIASQRTRTQQSTKRADRARKTLYEIRQTPVDVRRPVDDVRRNKLRSNLESIYPELIGR